MSSVPLETKVHVWMNRQNAEAESVNALGNTMSPMANVVSSKMISVSFTMHGMVQKWQTPFKLHITQFSFQLALLVELCASLWFQEAWFWNQRLVSKTVALIQMFVLHSGGLNIH